MRFKVIKSRRFKFQYKIGRNRVFHSCSIRLLTTYRALERLSQSEFNLDQLEAAATAAQSSHGATLLVPGTTGVPGASLIGRKERNHALTVRDVERERGNQLSKYERNMMIFNWLHTLDDSAVVDSVE